MRTSRDKAGVRADSFLVTFEAYDYYLSIDTFDTTEQEAELNEQSRKATSVGIAGFSYYYSGSVGSITCLPVDDGCFLRIGVFPLVKGEWSSAEQEV